MEYGVSDFGKIFNILKILKPSFLISLIVIPCFLDRCVPVTMRNNCSFFLLTIFSKIGLKIPYSALVPVVIVIFLFVNSNYFIKPIPTLNFGCQTPLLSFSNNPGLYHLSNIS